MLSPRCTEEDCRKQRKEEEGDQEGEREDMAGGKESRKETRARNKGPCAGQLEQGLRFCCSDPRLRTKMSDM